MLEAINKKELNFIQVLSMAITLFMQNKKGILMIVVMLFFPISILNVLILENMSNSAMAVYGMMQSGMFGGTPESGEALLQFFKMHGLQMAVFVFLEPVGIISVAKLVKSSLVKETVPLSQILGEAVNCLGGLILTGIPYLLLSFGGMMAFVLPGVYLLFIWTFYVYAIGLSGKKGWKALEYSRILVKGRFWKTAGSILIIALVGFSWNWILEGVYLLLPAHIGTDIFYNTLTYIVYSFAFTAMTILFLNREAVVLGKVHTATEGPMEENKEHTED